MLRLQHTLNLAPNIAVICPPGQSKRYTVHTCCVSRHEMCCATVSDQHMPTCHRHRVQKHIASSSVQPFKRIFQKIFHLLITYYLSLCFIKFLSILIDEFECYWASVLYFINRNWKNNNGLVEMLFIDIVSTFGV